MNLLPLVRAQESVAKHRQGSTCLGGIPCTFHPRFFDHKRGNGNARVCLVLRCLSQAQESIAQRRPEVAQARGRALLNLRLRDAEGGLLGRTLLSLVSNKVGVQCCTLCILLVRFAAGNQLLFLSWHACYGAVNSSMQTGAAVAGTNSSCNRLSLSVLCQGGGTISVPLMAHKVTPHDIVELRPSKGDASAPAIASGVVHRSATFCTLCALP